MTDRTVPHDADEYKDENETPRVDPSHIDEDPLVEKAESGDGPFPNRDEDEFTKRHLKEPPVDPELHEGNSPQPPPRGEEADPHASTPPIDPDASDN